MFELRHWLHVEVATRHEVRRFCRPKNSKLQEMSTRDEKELANQYQVMRKVPLVKLSKIWQQGTCTQIGKIENESGGKGMLFQL